MILTRILMLEAARQHDLPVANLETKAALVAVARYLDRLWIAETIDECQDPSQTLFDRNLLANIPSQVRSKVPAIIKKSSRQMG